MKIMFDDIQDDEFIEKNLILKTDCNLELESMKKDLEDE